MVGKTMFDKFTEQFEKNLDQEGRKRGSVTRAFEKANEDLGFDAYKNYSSYKVVRYREHNKRRKSGRSTNSR